MCPIYLYSITVITSGVEDQDQDGRRRTKNSRDAGQDPFRSMAVATIEDTEVMSSVFLS